jgi:hypothetical protein
MIALPQKLAMITPAVESYATAGDRTVPVFSSKHWSDIHGLPRQSAVAGFRASALDLNPTI